VKRFADLFRALDATTKSTGKLAALEHYFRTAPPRDAAWGLFFLSGATISRVVNSTELRLWLGEAAGLPEWLVAECYGSVGDLGETLALLFPRDDREAGADVSLADVVETILRVKSLPEDERRAVMLAHWESFDLTQRLILNKLITGSFRVGVARTQVLRGLARAFDLEPDVVERRFVGGFEPSVESFLRVTSREDVEPDRPRPYPFCLAHPVDAAPAEGSEWGDVARWQVEWKWDGIRAQLMKKRGEVLLWTRGEELVTHRFPEVAALGARLPDGTALDGEVLAWQDDAPMPFAALQKRIGKEKPGKKLLEDVPVTFVAYDILEHEGRDVRGEPMSVRRELLERVAEKADVRVSPLVEASTWEDLARERERSRELGREGLMIKARDSTYAAGRPRGTWWKWKVDPFTVDAVLVYAQLGNGRRAEIHSDYTFALRNDEGQLVPFAKAYSGLSDQELAVMDRWVRANTLERHGPVRVLKPELVFEVAFENVQVSTRHKCGLAVRFPRIVRQRTDKRPEDADSLDALRALVMT
jgi:DNA ligase-1